LKRFLVVLFLIISFPLFAGIPSSGYASQTVTNPSGALTDFTLIIDLANVCADQANFSTDWNTDTGGYGKATKGDGTTELATDWIDLDNSAETGWVRVKWSGTLASSGSQTVRLFPPNTGNDLYAANNAYGSDNAYDSNWLAYWPDGGGTDRTSNGFDGTEVGSITAGDSAGKIGAGTDFPGSSGNLITVANMGISGDQSLSILSWINPDVEDRNVVFGFGDPGTARQSCGFRTGDTDDYVWYWWAADITGASAYADYAAQGWLHYVGTYDTGTSTRRIYEDDIELDNDTPANADWQNQDYTIGAFNDEFMNGVINELQIHTTARSTDWLSEEYNQTDDNDTFWGAWAWTAPGGGLSIPVAMNHYRHLFNTIVFSMNLLLSIALILRIRYLKKKLLFYNDPDNIKALSEVNKLLEEGPQ